MQQRGSSPTRGPRRGILAGVGAVREGFIFFDLELKQRVTRRQIDVIALARVPPADNQATRVRIRFDFVNESRDLIDAVAFRIMPAERTPEVAIDRTEVAGLATKAAGWAVL